MFDFLKTNTLTDSSIKKNLIIYNALIIRLLKDNITP